VCASLCATGQIVAEAGEPKDRHAASVIYPIRKRGNLLLCTLLLGNVAVNALLSILMADLTNGALLAAAQGRVTRGCPVSADVHCC
jgi:hypothetical protein